MHIDNSPLIKKVYVSRNKKGIVSNNYLKKTI